MRRNSALLSTENHYGTRAGSVILISRTKDAMAAEAISVREFPQALLNGRPYPSTGIVPECGFANLSSTSTQ